MADRGSETFCLDEHELIQAISEAKTNFSVIESSVDPESASKEATTPTGPQSLVAFPAQSNFSGRKYPLEWVARCQATGLAMPSHK